MPPYSIRAVLTIAGSTIIALGVVGFLVAASGVYNVAASKPHFDITRALLQFALSRSVATHSWFAPSPPDLSNSDRIRLGAGHFVRGCAVCHGAPGEPRNAVTHFMRPAPPTLSLSVGEWTDKELFWIVENGFKYTGMPSWPAPERDEEIWSVVAFLRQLPEMSSEEYRKLTTGPVEAAPASPRAFGGEPIDPLLITECARCHGGEGAAPPSRLVPKLAGQKEAYLAHALADYAHRRRPSGIMEVMAVPLERSAQRAIAAYYASLPANPTEPQQVSREQIEHGQAIAVRGLPEEGVPACLACHSNATATTFPLLEGQHAPYVVQQLHVFKEGLRAGTAQGAVMTAIAKRLDDGQIEAVAAYFETLGKKRQAAEGARQ